MKHKRALAAVLGVGLTTSLALLVMAFYGRGLVSAAEAGAGALVASITALVAVWLATCHERLQIGGHWE